MLEHASQELEGPQQILLSFKREHLERAHTSQPKANPHIQFPSLPHDDWVHWKWKSSVLRVSHLNTSIIALRDLNFGVPRVSG
jgi:hypothetical protein